MVVPLVGAALVTKGIADALMKEKNIIDKWFGEEPSTSGDASVELVKYIAPENETLATAADVVSTAVNLAVPSVNSGFGILNKVNDAGTNLGLMDKLGNYFFGE